MCKIQQISPNPAMEKCPVCHPRLSGVRTTPLRLTIKSLTIHVSVLDLVVLVDAVRGIDYQGALLPFLLGEWLGATYILQHDFARGRDVCPVGTDVAVNISWRI